MNKLEIFVLFTFTVLLASCSSNPLDKNDQSVGFRDCEHCPAMIPIPLGKFAMGDLIGDGRDDEKPVQLVSIESPFAISKYPITVESFQHFIDATKYVTQAEKNKNEGCWGVKKDLSIGWLPTENWKNNRLNQDKNHPVVCVSWHDAQAYIQWLTAQTGHTYRLPTEAEWEYSARAGSETKYFYGNNDNHVCQYINHADYQMIKAWSADTAVSTCDDGYLTSSPVGEFPANRFGLYDAYGNVWEWVMDCYKPNLHGISQKSKDEECSIRTLRGASWGSKPVGITSSYRNNDKDDARTVDYGFRVARELK